MTQRSWEHVHQPHWNIVATAVADEVRKECAAEMENRRMESKECRGFKFCPSCGGEIEWKDAK